MNWPNLLTLLRIFLVPLFVVLLFQGGILAGYLSFLVFIIASLTDYYDGYLARKTGTVTRFGRFMDPFADKVLTSSAFISFALLGYIRRWMVIVIVFREVLITGLRVYGLYHRNPLITSRMAKWKTSSQVFAIYLILSFINLRAGLSVMDKDLAFLDGRWPHIGINGLVFLVMALTIVSGAHYLIQNLVLSKRRIK